jgi:hypothetical protein
MNEQRPARLKPQIETSLAMIEKHCGHVVQDTAREPLAGSNGPSPQVLDRERSSCEGRCGAPTTAVTCRLAIANHFEAYLLADRHGDALT